MPGNNERTGSDRLEVPMPVDSGSANYDYKSYEAEINSLGLYCEARDALMF